MHKEKARLAGRAVGQQALELPWADYSPALFKNQPARPVPWVALWRLHHAAGAEGLDHLARFALRQLVWAALEGPR